MNSLIDVKNLTMFDTDVMVNYFICSQCDYCCETNSQMMVHLNSHYSSNFSQHCVEQPLDQEDYLEKEYDVKIKLYDAITDEIKQDSDKFQCQICGIYYSDEDSLNYHIASAHIESNSIEYQSQNSISSEDILPTVKLFKCQNCDEVFTSKSSLNVHSKIHRTYHYCEHCDFRTFSEVQLTKHLLLHNPLRCHFCSFHTIKKRQFNSHMKEVHPETRIFSCSTPSRKPKLKNQKENDNSKPGSNKLKNVKNSFGAITSSGSAVKCPLCAYAGKSRTVLQRHMRTHTGERPYACDHCSYRCARKDNLLLHMRVHSKKRIWECDICGCAASTKGSITRHLNMHKNAEIQSE